MEEPSHGSSQPFFCKPVWVDRLLAIHKVAITEGERANTVRMRSSSCHSKIEHRRVQLGQDSTPVFFLCGPKKFRGLAHAQQEESTNQPHIFSCSFGINCLQIPMLGQGAEKVADSTSASQIRVKLVSPKCNEVAFVFLWGEEGYCGAIESSLDLLLKRIIWILYSSLFCFLSTLFLHCVCRSKPFCCCSCVRSSKIYARTWSEHWNPWSTIHMISSPFPSFICFAVASLVLAFHCRPFFNAHLSWSRPSSWFFKPTISKKLEISTRKRDSRQGKTSSLLVVRCSSI